MTTQTTATQTAADTKATAKGFKWNDENTAEIVAAYEAKAEAEGHAVANSAAHLEQLAAMVGNTSGARSVRQKLASVKAYVKTEAPAKAAADKPTKAKKLILASLICDAATAKDPSLGDAAPAVFASLENASRPALLALLALLQGRPMGTEDLEA